jgi:hypothetical protein
MRVMGELLELLAQFGGGPATAANAGVRYLLPAFFWTSLALIAWIHWRSAREDRDRLILLAALVGLFHEI